MDAAEAKHVVFPLWKVPEVRRRVAAFLRETTDTVLICAAACGADLIALTEAEHIGMHSKIVLPYNPADFKITSVTDRPGDWGHLFDHVVANAKASGNLIVLDEAVGTPEAYEAVNAEILAQAEALDSREKIVALVWDGSPRKSTDATASLGRLATRHGFTRRDIQL